MATEKTLKARLLMKTDTSANWAKATNFVPKAGEIIIYSDDERKIKVGDGLTKVSSLKFVNQDELAKIATLGDDLLAVKNGYLPLSGGTITETLTVSKELYSNAAVISKRNSAPQFIMQNANGAQLGSIYSTSSNGSYGNIAIVVNKDSSSAAYYTFSNFGRFASPNDIQTVSFRAKSNQNPSLSFLNNSEAVLSELYASTTDGSYGNVLLKVSSSATKASYFTFKNDGIFSAPSDIISNGGILKSSKDSHPLLALTNASGNWLTSLSAEKTDGSYGNAMLTVYKSATESYTFVFSNQGSFRASSTVYSSLFAVQSNNNPQLMLMNASGAPLGMLYMNTTTGAYSSAYLRVYSSASAYSTFNFGNDGKLSCGSLALATALPISSGGTGATTASGALANLGALPLTGGTLTGTLTATALYASDGNVTGSHLVTKTNNYPEVYFKNATGATLAEFYVDTTSGGFADVRLKVFSDASTAKYFTFGKDGAFGIPNSFSAPMGEIKNTAWPQLFFRNGDGNNLAQFVIPTDNGSYSGLAVNVFSDASTHVEYKFNSSGIFHAPSWVEGSSLRTKTNNYPELSLNNANGTILAELYANTTSGAYAPIILKVNQDANSAGYFTFGRDGSFTASAGITTAGNYLTIKNNSYPQLTFSNASGTDLGKVFVSTANGSYAGTKIRAYSSASSSYDFQFVGDGTFNCATLVPANALGIAHGGTGSNTAAGALTNLGALPLIGGTISKDLTVKGNIFAGDDDFIQIYQDAYYDGQTGVVSIGNANYGDWKRVSLDSLGCLRLETSMVYSDGDSVIYSPTEPTAPSGLYKGMIWLKPI